MYGADMLRQGIAFDDVFEMAVCNGLSIDDIQTLSKAKKLWKDPKTGEKIPKKKEIEVETYYEEPTEAVDAEFHILRR